MNIPIFRSLFSMVFVFWSRWPCSLPSFSLFSPSRVGLFTSNIHWIGVRGTAQLLVDFRPLSRSVAPFFLVSFENDIEARAGILNRGDELTPFVSMEFGLVAFHNHHQKQKDRIIRCYWKNKAKTERHNRNKKRGRRKEPKHEKSSTAKREPKLRERRE